MVRPIRVEYANAVYHVTARGNERKPICRDDVDRRRYLETVEQTVERFAVVIHAYCLMSNHYHLLMQTPRANLSAAVGWLQTTYSGVAPDDVQRRTACGSTGDTGEADTCSRDASKRTWWRKTPMRNN